MLMKYLMIVMRDGVKESVNNRVEDRQGEYEVTLAFATVV